MLKRRLSLGLSGRVTLGAVAPVPPPPSPTAIYDFISSDTLPAGVTFSRTSAANRLNSTGLVELAASGVGRITYTAAGQSLGLLLEQSATNPSLYGRDLTNAVWTKSRSTAAKTATGADGVANSASTLTATAANGLPVQVVAVTASQRTMSCYVRRRTGTGEVAMFCGATGANLVSNGTFDTDLTGWVDSSTAPATVSWSSGQALYNVTTGTARIRQQITTVAGKLYELAATGTGVLLSVGTSSGGTEILGNQVVGARRYFFATGTVTWINTAATSNGYTLDNVTVREMVTVPITLTASWAPYSITSTVFDSPVIGFKIAVSGDAIDVDYIGLEAGGVATSPIATTSAAVDRTADTATIALSESSDLLIQDRFGAEWRNGISSGTYTLTPRSGQSTVARVTVYQAGVLSAGDKTTLAVAA